jgi:hypothetical protein
MQPGRFTQGSPIRLRQHGTVFILFTKNSQREFFCEQQDLRGGSANWAFAHGNGPIRLRQHGTVFFFHKTFALCANVL